MGRPRSPESPRPVDSTEADLLREASAMTLLLKAGAQLDLLRDVRDQARALYKRATYGPLASRVPPTREELDAVWAIVPAPDLEWARHHVLSAVVHARESGTTATPQVSEGVGSARGIRAV